MWFLSTKSPGSGVVGNARALGARDRGFESRLPDHHDSGSRCSPVRVLDAAPADCEEVLHLFTLFSPTGRASLPIRVQWKLEVRATSFDSTPFGPEADITFTPRERN